VPRVLTVSADVLVTLNYNYNNKQARRFCWLLCVYGQSSCNLNQLPTIPQMLTAFVDLESVVIVLGYIMLQALLATVPIGFVTTGPTMADGKKLQYRNNG